MNTRGLSVRQIDTIVQLWRHGYSIRMSDSTIRSLQTRGILVPGFRDHFTVEGGRLAESLATSTKETP